MARLAAASTMTEPHSNRRRLLPRAGDVTPRDRRHRVARCTASRCQAAETCTSARSLEVFLGVRRPLDLLLYLIRAELQRVDIRCAADKQYLAYIEQIRRNNLELAAEYLLMARC